MSDEKEVSISTINQRLSSAFDAGNAVQFSIAAADAVVYAETLEQINERLHDRNKSQEARIKEIELELLSLRALRDAGDATDGEIEGDFGKVQAWIGRSALDSTEKYHESLAAESLDKIRSEFITRGQQLAMQESNSKTLLLQNESLGQENLLLVQRLREAQAEIERLRVSSFAAPEGTTIQSLQSQIATLTAELAALKAAPGMEEIDALWKEFKVKRHKLAIRLHGAELEEICQLDEIVMSIRRKSICSIASRDEVVGLLKHILSCIITVKQENTPEWMEYIAEEVNRINEAMGDLDRVSLRLGGIVIVKGGPEIAEGKNA